jgi:competence protein ComEA
VVDLNRATARELEALRGVGPVLAERIVETRRRLGGFRSVDQLLEVKGVGPAVLERLRERVRVGPGG